MAILSALLSLLSKKLSSILQAVFGWSITGLFGRLPSSKQTVVAVALVLSLAWPLLVIGAFRPELASWAIAMIPLHSLIGATALRIVWIVLAALAPLGVGALTAWAAPARKQKVNPVLVVLAGFPITIGFLVSFLVTVAIVPALKIAAVARGWMDEHVYVLIGPGAYRPVLDAVRHACGEADLILDEEPVPAPMLLASRALIFFARGAVGPLVESEPRRLKGADIELYLYPGDLLVRGKPALVAKVRAALLVHLVRAPAHLTSDPHAQSFEDELTRGWEMVDRRGRGNVSELGKSRIRELAHDLDRLAVPFEDWVLLYTNLHLLERAALGGPELVDGDARNTVMETTSATPTHAENGLTLVKDAIADGKALMLLELELAKAEAEKELGRAKTAGIALGLSLALAGAGIALCAVGLLMALGGGAIAALIAGGSLLAGAGAAAYFGVGQFPANPFERTRARLKTDVQIMKEHIA